MRDKKGSGDYVSNATPSLNLETTLKSSLTYSRALRLSPLAACLALACGADASATSTQHKGFSWATISQSHARITSRPLARANNGSTPNSHLLASTLPVTSCGDDADPGTLRNVIGTAGDGDTIDMTALTSCPSSKITLTQGEIAIAQTSLIIQGPTPTPAGPALTVDGGSNGRVLNAAGDLTVESLQIANGAYNRDDDYASGGCVLVSGAATISNSTVTGCKVTGAYVVGGGIAAFGDLTVTNSTISNSYAGTALVAGTESYLQALAGGAYCAGTLTMSNSIVSANTATLVNANGVPYSNVFIAGGGVAISPFAPTTTTSNISFSTISGNYAWLFGGGVYTGASTNAQTLVVSNSTISGNYGFAGGGFRIGASKQNLTVQNSTISGNYSFYGAAMLAPGASSLVLANSTVAFNYSYKFVGGIYASSTSNTINSTIISNNTAAQSAPAAGIAAESPATVTIAGNNNIVFDIDASVTFTNPVITVDPQLLPLADNGGPTQTHAIPSGSSAQDAGNNAAGLTTDQRGYGFPRTVGAGTDIGSFELLDDRIFFNGFEP
jgi:hypothetical protein